VPVNGHDPWAKRSGLTAILIAVPELAGYTDRWRMASSSSARPGLALSELIPSHVTVLVPWLKDPTPEHVQRLTDAVAKLQPFELSFPSAGQFPNGTVWLRPEPFDQVRALVQTVRLDDLTIWREGDDHVWQLTGSVPLG
jgi:2'-5' RNA ligase